MCYQTRQIRTVKDLELRYKVNISNSYYRDLFDQPSYHLNGFAHPNMLLIPQQKPTVLAPGIWGIVPESKSADDIQSYYKESVRFGSGLNAQSEKLFEHFIYRNSVMTKRCIIPVTGFFEPHTHNKNKFPIYIHRKDDALFSLAGIYTIIGKHVTFTILTKEANPFFAKIHNQKKRQPVILEEEEEKHWLSKNLDRDELYQIINRDTNTEVFEAYPVSKDLYKHQVNTNEEDITQPVYYEDLKEISFK